MTISRDLWAMAGAHLAAGQTPMDVANQQMSGSSDRISPMDLKPGMKVRFGNGGGPLQEGRVIYVNAQTVGLDRGEGTAGNRLVEVPHNDGPRTKGAPLFFFERIGE